MKKVVIVGAGPCGVLLAHYLLRRDSEYQIDIYERRSDPRQIVLSNSRTIPYGLSERGLSAVRKIEGLEAAVKSQCVENHANIIHKKNGKTQIWLKKQPTFNTDRTSLVIALLSQLTENFDNSKLRIHFNSKCSRINFEKKTVTFEKVTEPALAEDKEEFTVNYDLLIGTDGARSVVRTHFMNTEFFEFEQKYVNSAYKTLFFPGINEKTGMSLKSNCLHIWRIEEGVNFGAIPQIDGKFIGLLFFPKKKNKVVSLSSKEEVMSFFRQNVPEVSQLLTEEEAEAFLKRPISTQLRTRCNRYHYGDSVLIMGDAGHAVSSSLGQGCNNAFEDVLILNNLLDEYSENWANAVEQFTIRRLPDARALWEIDTNVFPTSKILFAEFLLREKFSRIMNKLFPQIFFPPLRDLIPSSTIPYADILKLHKGWISKVKSSNEKFFQVRN
ncbi:MAG: FAD-dependent oxidoreductase [Aulosira sp. ZfuVER01]|nr:NAD(P)/FAD-dependent oxidoreductase [Aulosira sp. ZfuVER01]MDZ7996826.1 NAD(P)/FAD-dependent oxidoreductase [Aulosira sp. DedVER01a]MDZ8049952.1 NAD(P)/FAD-dependent oxidoreductase [Aulosira sp. ZfuCHP01]